MGGGTLLPGSPGSYAGPGREAVVTTDLEPGTYAMICYLPNSEGTPHVMIGMAQEFTVS